MAATRTCTQLRDLSGMREGMSLRVNADKGSSFSSWEMTQSVKCLSGKCENPSSAPQHPHRNLGLEAHACPRAEEEEGAGRPLGLAAGLDSLVGLAKCRPMRDAVSTTRGGWFLSDCTQACLVVLTSAPTSSQRSTPDRYQRHSQRRTIE